MTTNRTSEQTKIEGAISNIKGLLKVPQVTHCVASNLGDPSQDISCDIEILDLSTKNKSYQSI